jgi:two-component system phosphate regulon response regulator PhoB
MRNTLHMSQPKILVVEDNPHARELLVLVLEREHYEVMEAANGAEALERVTGEEFDLIFLDLGLPMITGDEVVRRIKSDPCTARIPIVVNTAFDPEASIVKDAIAAGADEVLYKPADFQNFIPVARRFVDKRY